ncbi:hypothetical protein [Desulfobacter curvatus]|uniref:hypothetical protein n=1 Tax=Desulfobacter curvatus TaxID=2290 RepID=UPI000380F63F|nr:hypothetical protein [Desulfobacter curvatus]
MEIIDNCDNFARLFGEVKPVFRRIGRTPDAIYIDLGTPGFDVIEITGESVREIQNPPVKFIRSKIQLPIEGAKIDAQSEDLNLLKKYVKFKAENDFILFVAWLMSCLNTDGGYPPLFLVGEQGSAKSTVSTLIKNLLDESTVPLRNLSTGMRNLMIAASNDFILCYDNLSKITDKQSDNLCKLATGAGFTTRKLYTTNEEIQLLCKNPIVINSVAMSPTRQDLADRSIIVELAFISPEERKTSKEIWESWKQDRPAILGALCKGVSAALRNFDQVSTENLPRMADFAKWVIAGEDGLPWENGTFLKTMQTMRTTLVEESIDADSTALAVLKFMKDRNNWKGTATSLLADLVMCIEPDKQKYPQFPKLPNHLSRNLKRISAFLREKGILFEKEHSGSRSISLTKIIQNGEPALKEETPKRDLDDRVETVQKVMSARQESKDLADDSGKEKASTATAASF